MAKRLNQEYFKTKKKHKENYKSVKLTFKKGVRNLLITATLIFVSNLLHKSCNARIEKNKLEAIKETHIINK